MRKTKFSSFISVTVLSISFPALLLGCGAFESKSGGGGGSAAGGGGGGGGPTLDSDTVVVGGKATVILGSTDGTPPFTYQWRKNTVPIQGETGTSFAITSAQLADAGNYDLVVTNSVGSATSNRIPLHVYDPVSKTWIRAPKVVGATLEPSDPQDLKFKISN
jgi:hypothetical protein